MSGIFFVNTPQKATQQGCFFRSLGGATLSSNRALRALQAQQNPVRIRRSFVGANCVRPRAFKERPYGQKTVWQKFFQYLAIRPKVCYNKTRKAVGV